MEENRLSTAIGRVVPAQAYLMLATTVFLWALGIVLARSVHEEVPPIGLSFWRWFGAFFILILFVQQELREKLHIVRQNIRVFLVQGALMAGSGTLMFSAVNFTTAINAALVNATQPVMTGLLAWVILRDRLRGIQILGIVSALLGVGSMVSKADWHVIATLSFNVGDFLVILATLGFSLYAINIRNLPTELNAFPSLCVIMFSGSMLLLPLYVAESMYLRTVPFDPKIIAIIAILAIFVSIAAIGMWNIANRVVGPGRAAIFLNLIPVYGALMAILFLNEELFFYHIFGAAFVCVGILMVIAKPW